MIAVSECAACRFWHAPAVPVNEQRRVAAERAGFADRPGQCRRYPQWVAHYAGDGCGEWQPKEDGGDGARQ